MSTRDFWLCCQKGLVNDVDRWKGQDCELGRKQNPHPFLFIVGNKKFYIQF